MRVFERGHAIVIGAGGDLPFTTNDATAIYNVLVNREQCGFESNKVQLLVGTKASKARIEYALNRLRATSKSDSTVIIYFSGHAVKIQHDSGPKYYFLPNGYSKDRPAETGIEASVFFASLEQIRASKIVLLFDCCHSGGIQWDKVGNTKIVKAAMPGGTEEFANRGANHVVISSCRKDESSFGGTPYSVFTQSLLEAFSLPGAHNDGFLRVTDLSSHANYRVPILTNDDQHPLLHFNNANNFVVSLSPASNKQTAFESLPAGKKVATDPKNAPSQVDRNDQKPKPNIKDANYVGSLVGEGNRVYQTVNKNGTKLPLFAIFAILSIVVALLVYINLRYNNWQLDSEKWAKDSKTQNDQLKKQVSDIPREIVKDALDVNVLVGMFRNHSNKVTAAKLREADARGADWREKERIRSAELSQLFHLTQSAKYIADNIGDSADIFAEAIEVMKKKGLDEAIEMLESYRHANSKIAETLADERDESEKISKEKENELRSKLNSHLLEAMFLELNHEWCSAIEIYDYCAKVSRRWSTPMIKMSSLYNRLQMEGSSLNSIKQAIEYASSQTELADSYHMLGDLYRKNERLNDAEEAYRESLRLAESAEVNDRGLVRLNLTNLASMLLQTNRGREAGILFLKAYSIKIPEKDERPFSSISLDLEFSKYLNGRRNYSGAGDFIEKAIRLNIAVLEVYRANIDSIAPSLINDLAINYSNRSQAETCIKLHCLAISKELKALGQVGAVSGRYFSNFAADLSRFNHHYEALPLHLLAVQTLDDKQKYASNYLIKAVINLCETLVNLERNEDALKLAVKLLLSIESTPSNHTELGSIFVRIGAGIVADDQNFAIGLDRLALRLHQESHASGQAFLTMDMVNLAEAMGMRSFGRNIDLELALLLTALRIEEENSPNSSKSALVLNSIGVLLLKLKITNVSELAFRRALLISAGLNGVDTPKAAIRLNNLAVSNRESKNFKESELCSVLAISLVEKHFDAGDSNVTEVLKAYAYLCQMQNRFLLAEVLFRRSLAVINSKKPDQRAKIGGLMNDIALCMMQRNDNQFSVPLLRHAIREYEVSNEGQTFNFALPLNNIISQLGPEHSLLKQSLQLRICLIFENLRRLRGKKDPRHDGFVEGYFASTGRAGLSSEQKQAFIDKAFGELEALPTVTDMLNDELGALATTKETIISDSVSRDLKQFVEFPFSKSHASVVSEFAKRDLKPISEMIQTLERELISKYAMELEAPSWKEFWVMLYGNDSEMLETSLLMEQLDELLGVPLQLDKGAILQRLESIKPGLVSQVKELSFSEIIVSLFREEESIQIPKSAMSLVYDSIPESYRDFSLEDFQNEVYEEIRSTDYSNETDRLIESLKKELAIAEKPNAFADDFSSSDLVDTLLSD